MPRRPWVTFDHESIKRHEGQRYQSAEMSIIQTDYLVVGAGATAMSFVDTLLSETDADVTMVDRRYRPGGHWNDAYPFVRLHQPSAY